MDASVINIICYVNVCMYRFPLIITPDVDAWFSREVRSSTDFASLCTGQVGEWQNGCENSCQGIVRLLLRTQKYTSTCILAEELLMLGYSVFVFFTFWRVRKACPVVLCSVLEVQYSGLPDIVLM